jgi:hypothetical protein
LIEVGNWGQGCVDTLDLTLVESSESQNLYLSLQRVAEAHWWLLKTMGLQCFCLLRLRLALVRVQAALVVQGIRQVWYVALLVSRGVPPQLAGWLVQLE